MEESTKKIFKPKFELVQECNGLVSIHLRCCGYTSRDRNHWNHPGRSSNVGGVSYILRDIALNALGVRPEELCQDKARNLYIIYQIAYVVNIQTSSERCLSQGKGQRRSVLSIPRTISK
jgi:hypothetical protein